MRVLVAMSGGVDSSAAAAALLQEGHEVTGVTLRLLESPTDSGCCSIDDVEDARRCAAALGIDHHVFNLASEFAEKVIDPYVRAHAEGATPNPCIECNRHLKFDHLLGAARRLGFDRLATGHHARVLEGPTGPELRRGLDEAKDQSYVLSMLSPMQLASVLLPVGEMTKAEVRALAARAGLPTAGKAESQDTCFIGSGTARRDFLSQRTELHAGEIVEQSSGEVVGEVAAVELVTLGQRRGLGVDASGRRRVAVAVDVAARRVVVAEPERALVEEVRLVEASTTWAGAPLLEGERCLVQLRSHAPAMPATFRHAAIELDAPSSPVAPGQTAALYDALDPGLVRGSALVGR